MEESESHLEEVFQSLSESSGDKPQEFSFSEFAGDDLNLFFSYASIKRLSESEVLITNEGTTSDLFFILEGHLEVEVSSAPGWNKVLSVGPGTVVGEQSFLDGEPRTATVIAATPCMIASISQESFETFANANPSIALRIIRQLTRILSRRLRRLDLFDAIEYTKEIERKRLAEELHDETMADLTGLTMELGLLKIHKELDEAVLGEIDSTREKLKDTNLRLRQIVKGIYPAELANSGLLPALTSHLKDLEQRSIQNPTELKIRLRSNGFGDKRLPSNLEGDLYRVIQQAIANAVQHAEASLIEIYINWSHQECKFSITDNGRGLGSIDGDAIVKSGHFGLANMRDRIERNGGLFEIGSATGPGASLIGNLPVTHRSTIPTQETNYEVTIKKTS